MPKFFENWVYRLCEKVAKLLLRRHPQAYRLIPKEGDTYLARYYLWPTKDPVYDEQQREREDSYQPSSAWQLHLHRFHRSDADHELHNHPQKWGLSLILTGGYREERRVRYVNGQVSYRVEKRVFKPFSFNFIRSTDFHRVDLLDEARGCWTLFLTGPRIQDWGFWDRNTGEYTPWRPFTMHKSRRNYGEGCANSLRLVSDTRNLRGNGVEAVASSRGAALHPAWIPEDRAEDAPWNGDEEAFGEPKK